MLRVRAPHILRGEGGMNLAPGSPLMAHATGPKRLMMFAIKKVDFFFFSYSLLSGSSLWDSLS